MTARLSPTLIVSRAAQDNADGAYVNLGFGETPAPQTEDWDLSNAGNNDITLKPAPVFFHHANAFAMVRGGHLDMTIRGANEAAETGDLANRSTGTKGTPAIGGAMDPVHGAKRVPVITDQVTMGRQNQSGAALLSAADRRRLRDPRLLQSRRYRHRRRAFCLA